MDYKMHQNRIGLTKSKQKRIETTMPINEKLKKNRDVE